MKFQRNRKYRHKNCIDVDIRVLDIYLEDQKLIMLKILWLNRNWSSGNFVIDSDVIKIKKEDYNNWKVI